MFPGLGFVGCCVSDVWVLSRVCFGDVSVISGVCVSDVSMMFE